MPSSRAPSTETTVSITPLLHAWGGGDPAAGERLFRVIYRELHAQAGRVMRRLSPGQTLQTTALVHEAYLRLAERHGPAWQGRGHFFGVAARAMRHALIDHVRAQRASKRGGGERAITLDELESADATGSTPTARLELLALHEALDRLAVLDPKQARLVELRYFAGLSIEETAEVLAVSPATVKREWAIARAWLRLELGAS
jgi:RNA polymerase sigma factor (TIGR02999 family)